MSALAWILVKRGYSITGSDPKNNLSVQKLLTEGVKIFKKQSAENISTLCNRHTLSPLIIFSSAIPQSNPELSAAKQANLDIWHRSDLLAALIQKQPAITIAGSHGKTTKSKIVTTLLALANQDPTAVIGGIVPYFNSNSHSGQGRLLIAEADESDGTLVKFKSELGIITNLELDHTDHYLNIDELIKTMKKFGQGCKQLLVNYDCLTLRSHFKPSFWWSVKTKKNVDFAALPISMNGQQTIAEVYEQGVNLGTIKLPMPGMHNLSNCMGAIAACRIEGLSFNQIQKSIRALESPCRRFDFRGTWSSRQIVDDYAHHPSEIEATLKMARLMVQTGCSPLPQSPTRVLLAFQPHRYTRTKKFLNDFAKVLGAADELLLAPIYGAGETPIEGINHYVLAQNIKKIHPKLRIGIAENLDQLTELIVQNSLKGDLILTMGAGDINSLWGRLIRRKNKDQWLSKIAA